MKNAIGLIILLLLCIGLGVALVVSKKQAAEQRREAEDKIAALSTKVKATTTDLEEQRGVTAGFEADLQKTKEAFGELTNNFLQLSGRYSQLNANFAKTEASLKATEEEIKKREQKIAELQNQNQALDAQALDLSSAITNLTGLIAETERKLQASEGDKAFLEKELQRLMAEKAELERQFNDLAVLRAQVTRLKEELSIARRIEWIRQGIFANTELKGAQRLVQGLNVPRTQPKTEPDYDLNVELTSEGTVRVIPPVTNAPVPVTNGAAAKQ